MLSFIQKSSGKSCISAVTEIKPHCPAAIHTVQAIAAPSHISRSDTSVRVL